MAEILLVACAYFLGAVPFGLIFTRLLSGRDPREHGSGNIGATNTMRTGGRLVGLLTLTADVGKGALPVVIAVQASNETTVAATAVAAFLGHIFPVFLRFRGGKGVATMFGVILAWQPVMAIVAFGIWLVVLWLSRYVSVASMLAGASLPVSAWWLETSAACLTASVLFCLLMIIRHHSNIKRLIDGTEDKIGEGSAEP